MSEQSEATSPGAELVNVAVPSVRILGCQGTFLEWGVGIVEHVLAVSGVAALRETLASARIAGPSPGQTRLLISHGPVMERDDVAAGAASPAIVFLEDPAVALAQMVGVCQDPVDATRAVTEALAPLAGAFDPAQALVVTRPDTEDMAALCLRIHALLLAGVGLPADAAGITVPPPPADAPPLKGVALTMLRQIIRPMWENARGAGRGMIVWPMVCLYSSEFPGEPATPIVDVTGPARALCFGPYFCLPRGRWRVETECFFSEGLDETLMAVDVAGPHDGGRFEFQPPGAGLFKVSFTLEVTQPGDHLEGRLWSERGAIKGRAGLWHIAFVPMDALARA